MWNLLVKQANTSQVKTSTHRTYEQGRYEQETIIKQRDPVWTALVRDKKGGAR